MANKVDSVPGDPTAVLGGDERWEIVQRVVSSRTFAGSPPLQSFLLYVAQQTLLGRADQIKEQAIGSHVLHRRPDYDPSADNIVRVRARQLRLKLDQYFGTEGALEPVIISIPKGGYVPFFEARPVSEGAKLVPPRPGPHWTLALPWLLVGVLSILCIALWLRPIPQNRAPAGESLSPELRQFWSQIFTGKGEEALLVLGDSGFALWQDLAPRTVTLADYLDMKYLEKFPTANPDLKQVASRRYTTLADASLATKIMPVSRILRSSLKTRFARYVDVRDLKGGNVILLGSRRSNPWVEIFESHLHYTWNYDVQARRPFFRNRSPRQGEAEILTPDGVDEHNQDSYAVVALLPNINNTGKVLLIEGLSMEGTDAAGELLLNPQSCGALLQRLAPGATFTGKPFETLLKLTPVAGGSANTKVISVQAPLP